MSVLPTSAKLKELQDLIQNSINEFGLKNIEFASLFNRNVDTVLRFDEVLTQKASKITLEDKILEVQKKYDPKISDIYQNLAAAQAERDQYVAGFEKFTKLVN
jgi:hypothetical protein